MHEQYHLSGQASSHGKERGRCFEGSETGFPRVTSLFLADSIHRRMPLVHSRPIGSSEGTTEIAAMGMQVKRIRRPDCPMSGAMGLPLQAVCARL